MRRSGPLTFAMSDGGSPSGALGRPDASATSKSAWRVGSRVFYERRGRGQAVLSASSSARASHG